MYDVRDRSEWIVEDQDECYNVEVMGRSLVCVCNKLRYIYIAFTLFITVQQMRGDRKLYIEIFIVSYLYLCHSRPFPNRNSARAISPYRFMLHHVVYSTPKVMSYGVMDSVFQNSIYE